jgi:endoglycosylceramidase
VAAPRRRALPSRLLLDRLPVVPCSQQEPDAFREARESTRRNGVAALLTEFGATDDLSTLRRIVNLADRNGEGWQYWQYKTYDDPTTQSSSEPGGADAESIVSEAGKVKPAKLRVLGRAFPSRIAGSGATWSYNDRTGRFKMSWRASPRSVTTVEIPRFRFGRDVQIVPSGGVRSAVALGGVIAISASGRSAVSVSPG